MPRDKTESHERIIAAAMREFCEKGFEQASMKAIADEVGMTSAALYRHFDGKQEMFAALVQPALDALVEWREQHVSASYDMLEAGGDERMWDSDSAINDASLVLDVMYQQPDQFYLLICCSQGTPYERYVHDFVEGSTDEMMRYWEQCKEHGYPVREIGRDDMHMLVSAYVAAVIQPIEHRRTKAEAQRYLRTVMDFFAPGWRMILGM